MTKVFCDRCKEEIQRGKVSTSPEFELTLEQRLDSNPIRINGSWQLCEQCARGIYGYIETFASTKTREQA